MKYEWLESSSSSFWFGLWTFLSWVIRLSRIPYEDRSQFFFTFSKFPTSLWSARTRSWHFCFLWCESTKYTKVSCAITDWYSYSFANGHVKKYYRRYSDKSKKHVKTLDELEYAFSELVARVASLRSRSIDQNGSRDTFLRVQGEIAQIAGDVDKFQVWIVLLRIFGVDFSNSLIKWMQWFPQMPILVKK